MWQGSISRSWRRLEILQRRTGPCIAQKAGSCGSATDVSRSQLSFCKMSCSKATSVAFASRSGKGYEFGRPAAVYLIGNHNLAGLVDQLDQDVLSKIRQRGFLTKLPYPCWPSFRTRCHASAREPIQRAEIACGPAIFWTCSDRHPLGVRSLQCSSAVRQLLQHQRLLDHPKSHGT